MKEVGCLAVCLYQLPRNLDNPNSTSPKVPWRTNKSLIIFPVRLRNRLISTGLEPVLSHTEKSCIASYYTQFSTNIKIKIIRFKPFLLARLFGLSGLTNCLKRLIREKKHKIYTWFSAVVGGQHLLKLTTFLYAPQILY